METPHSLAWNVHHGEHTNNMSIPLAVGEEGELSLRVYNMSITQWVCSEVRGEILTKQFCK